MNQKLYKLLNKVKTDYSKYEKTEMSQADITQIKSRISNKLAVRAAETGYDSVKIYNQSINKAAANFSRFARAAAVIVACSAICGSVVLAAAAIRMKNKSDDFIIDKQGTNIVSDENNIVADGSNNTVTKEMVNNDLGLNIRYDVSHDGKDIIELESIDYFDNNLRVRMAITFDNSDDVTALKEAIEYQIDGEVTTWNYIENPVVGATIDEDEEEIYEDIIPDNTEFRGLFVKTVFNPESNAINADSAGYYYNFEGNKLHLSLNIDAREVAIGNTNTLSIFLRSGRPCCKDYNLNIQLPNVAELYNNDVDTRDIDIHADDKLYGFFSKIDIEKYSVGPHGLSLYGNWDWDTDETKQSESEKANMKADGVCFAVIYHRVRAWDDLGNSYLLTPGPTERAEKLGYTYEWTIPTDNDSNELFKRSWDENANKITFVVEKEWYAEHRAEHDESAGDPNEYEYSIKPVTIDAHTGEIITDETLPDPLANKKNGDKVHDGEDHNNGYDLRRAWPDYCHTEKTFHSEDAGMDINYEIITKNNSPQVQTELTKTSYYGNATRIREIEQESEGLEVDDKEMDILDSEYCKLRMKNV